MEGGEEVESGFVGTLAIPTRKLTLDYVPIGGRVVAGIRKGYGQEKLLQLWL